MNTGRLDGSLFTGTKPEDILKKSADQAEHLREELRIGSMTKADPEKSHTEEIKRITNNYDEEDARTALDVLVIKHPFIVMDTLKGYFQSMDEDLKELRKVFTQREAYENDICGGDRI